eukprot:gene9078-1173_t
MEQLLHFNKNTEKTSRVVENPLKHPFQLKNIGNFNKKIFLCFVNDIKVNLQTLRILRQFSKINEYDLILIHLEKDNFSEQHFITKTVHDKTGELFDFYNIDYHYKLEDIQKFTENLNRYRKSCIIEIVCNNIQQLQLYTNKIDLSLFGVDVKLQEDLELNLIFNILNEKRNSPSPSERKNRRSCEITTHFIDVAPQNFESLLQIQEAKKLFANYVIHHFGEHLINCYDDLLEYNEHSTIELSEKILNYCIPTSGMNIIFNPDFREKILSSNNKFKENGTEWLLKFVSDILSKEFYPRFINSKSWKNYLNLNFSNDRKSFEDVYNVKKILKVTESFLETNQLLSVENKVTHEIFTAKRIFFAATKNHVEQNYLDLVEHKHILNVIEYFTNDSTNHFNKKSTTIVTTQIDTNLEKFIENCTEKLISIEIVDYLIQTLFAFQEFHKKSSMFKLGQLSENIIYLSNYNTVKVDPGIYNQKMTEEEYLDNCPVYLLPPEKIVSEKSDVFSIGMIFFRMISLLSAEETQKLFFVPNLYSKKSPQRKKTTRMSNNRSSKSLRNSIEKIVSSVNLVDNGSSKKRRSVSIKRLSSFLSNSMKGSKTYEYFENIKDLLSEYFMNGIYEEQLLQIIIEMVDPNPELRPTVDELLITLLEKIKPLFECYTERKKSKFDGLDSYLKKLITDDSQRPFLKEYLRTEFAVESILFLEDCRFFRKIETDQERFNKAEEMCQTYLLDDSPLEINISGGTKTRFFSFFEEAKQSGSLDKALFDRMETHIFDTMMIDSLPRFEESDIGKEFLQVTNKNLF